MSKSLPVYFSGPEKVKHEAVGTPTDKREFYKGDWRKAWPRDFEVKEGGIMRNQRRSIGRGCER